MTGLSSIAAKLRALRDLADNPGATEAERLNAAEKYETILHKYHLDASELELREEGVAHTIVEFGTRGNSFVTGRLMGLGIARFTKCRTWVNERAGEVHMLGLRSDAEFAEWLLWSLVGHVQASALSFSFDATPGDLFAGDVEAFAKSAAVRIRERLDALAHPEGTGTALVVVRARMIDEEFAKLGLRLHESGPIQINGRGHAIAAGQAAGDRASFGRPVNGQAQALRIGRN